MMKFVLPGSDGTPTIFIGLEAANIEKLKQGRPIFFDAAILGIDGVRIAIGYGQTKNALLDDLEKAGLKVPPEWRAQVDVVGNASAFDA